MKINTDVGSVSMFNTNRRYNISNISLENQDDIKKSSKNVVVKTNTEINKDDWIKTEQSKGMINKLSFEIKKTNLNNELSFEELPAEMQSAIAAVTLKLATSLVPTKDGMKSAIPIDILNQFTEELHISFYNEIKEYKATNNIDKLSKEDYLKIVQHSSNQIDNYSQQNKLSLKNIEFYFEQREFNSREFKLSFFKHFIDSVEPQL